MLLTMLVAWPREPVDAAVSEGVRRVLTARESRLHLDLAAVKSVLSRGHRVWYHGSRGAADDLIIEESLRGVDVSWRRLDLGSDDE
jgi:hypothetical protein